MQLTRSPEHNTTTRQLEAEALHQVSPRSPLVSTTLVENGWVCGGNDHGQLGVGGTARQVDPTPLSSLRWKAVSLGGKHSAGVGDGGEVYTWGVNDQGQLGAPGGPRAGQWDVPRRVELLYGWDVQGVACGDNHTVAITNHDVITWGANDTGQCGHGERAETDWVKPRSLKLLHGQMVTQVVCGANHTMCVTATSLVYAWGENSRGQLGLGDVRNRRSPALVNGLWALPVRQLAAGESHSAALTSNGFLFTWGDASQGQLGLPLSTEEANTAQLGRSASERRRISRRVNQRFVQTMLDMGIPEEQAELALMETGNVGVEVAAEWLFSVPPDVLLSHLSGEADTAESPTASLDATPINSLRETGVVNIPRRVPLQKVRSMAVGANHTLACTDDDVYSWGCNSHGQLGNGAVSRTEKHPYNIGCLRRHRITLVAAGSRHSVFLGIDGTVYACGDLSGLVPDALGNHDSAEATDVCSLRGSMTGSMAGLGRMGSMGSTGSMGSRLASPSAFPPVATMATTAAASYTDVNRQISASMVDKVLSGRLDSVLSEVLGTQGDLINNASMADNLSSASYASAVSSVPIVVPLGFLEKNLAAPSSSNSAVVGHVVCGDGTTAFLTRKSDELPELPPPLLRERLQAALESVVQLEDGERQEYVKPICNAVEKVFGSAAAISSAFGVPDAVGLESSLLEDIQTKVMSLEPPAAPKLGEEQPERDELYKSMRVGLESLVLDIERNIKLMGTPERAQVLLAAIQSPLLGDSRCANSLIPRVCNIVLASPSTCRHLLVGWWAAYDPSLLETRVVRPLQTYLTDELYATKKLTISVMNAIKVLALVEEANQLGRLLPPEAFYNELISEKLDVLDHYVAWRQTHDMPRHTSSSDGPFSFCSYPFLLNPRAKSKLLQTEARIQMDQTVADARVEAQSNPGASLLEGPILRPKNRVLTGRGAGGVGGAGGRGRQRAAGPGGGGGGGGPVSRRPSRESRFQVFPRLFPRDRQVQDDGVGALASDDDSDTEESGSGTDGPYNVPDSSTQSNVRSPGLRDATTPPRPTLNATYFGDVLNPSTAPVAATPAPAAMSRGPGFSHSHQLGTSTVWKQNSLGLPAPEESGFPGTHPEMCIVRIRRCHLLEDALNEIARQRPRDLFKPLRIHFIGEDGVDAGGVKKEFFQLLMAELLSQDYGMLVFQEDTRTYWFDPGTFEADDAFFLLGLTVGLAVYNGVLLDLPLPLALYRKILGMDVKLRDLKDIEPTLGRSLEQIIEFSGPGSVEDVFCQTFSIPMLRGGELVHVPLCPGGENVPVTEENRREFVDLYVRWWLSDSVEKQFEAFAKGLLTLCGGPALQLFSPTELERLVCGTPCLDFEGLEKAAKYDGGFHPEHRVVRWLWQVIGRLNNDEKKSFLKFVTGSDRAPIGGLANLRVIVQRDGADSNKLPTSHTCFNTLLLPSYRSSDKLEDRLRLAILNAEGFGLE